MNSGYIIGIDVGTTGIKAEVFDACGKPIVGEYGEYPLICPYPGWAEQDPNQWWAMLQTILRRLVNRMPVSPADIVAIGTTGQQASSVLLDEKGKVLCNSLLWMDRRTTYECEMLEDAIGLDRLYEDTGLRPDPMYTIYKLMWIKAHDPDTFTRTQLVLQPKDFINYKLTGVLATDHTSAAATQAYNLTDLSWNDEILEAAGVSAEVMPPVYESSHIIGRLDPSVAASLRLSPQTLVAVGGGDTTVSALGCGVADEGDTAIVVGTSSDVVTCVNTPAIDPDKRIGCYPYVIPGSYITIAGANSSGVALKWHRDQFFAEEKRQAEREGRNSYDVMLDKAKRVPAGSEGLVFLPYLAGERSPIYNPYAKGIFAGISLLHTKHHFTRAIIEGVSLSIRDRFSVYTELGLPISRIILTGGGAKNSLWRQIITDMIGQPTFFADIQEAASLGAAMLASVGGGMYPSVEAACRGMAVTGEEMRPGEDMWDVYDNLYRMFKTLYSGSIPFYDMLAELTHENKGE